VTHADFNGVASENNIPIYILEEKMSESALLQEVRRWKPDLFVVVGWFHIVPKVIRDMAPAVGIHASLLPKYRGGAPLVWAMINGEKRTGVTLFHMEEDVDSGDIIAQKHFDITQEDNIATMIEKAEMHSKELLKEYLPKIVDGSANRIRQDEAKATHYPQRSPEDGRIDWSWPKSRIEAFIRSQTKPYPGAFIDVGKYRVRIWDADIEVLK
jgi:methionyl-tRNA formyltransferase